MPIEQGNALMRLLFPSVRCCARLGLLFALSGAAISARSQVLLVELGHIRLKVGAIQLFTAGLAGAGEAPPPAVTWMLVGEDGFTPAPPGFGHVDPDGTYHAPGGFLDFKRQVWVRATDSSNPDRHAVARVEIVSDDLQAALKLRLGSGWRATRVEQLGTAAGFRDLHGVAFAPWIPVTDELLLRDQRPRIPGPDGGWPGRAGGAGQGGMPDPGRGR